jgi:hemolysin III
VSKNQGQAPFGFHEVFHSFTILAFIAHYVGVSLATYALR